VLIKVQGEDQYVSMEPWQDESNPSWTQLAMDQWKGTVQSGAHGVKEVAIPKIGSIKARDPETNAKGYYHANAGLVIKNKKAYDQDGNLLSLPEGTITVSSLYDAREGRYVLVTNVDISLLNSSGFPANGLLYAYRTNAVPSQPQGVRLINGSELAGPLTVVSEDPLYIQGDYNTVNKKGAAVITDAVNLLSNAWDDTKTSSTIPNATETTYNLAMISGNVPTPDGGGTYSGGLENFPRLHERWTDVSCNIRGSFICLFESEIATAPWKYGGNRYYAPIRNWRFDRDLLKSAFTPPYSPNVVSLDRLLWDDGRSSTLAESQPLDYHF